MEEGGGGGRGIHMSKQTAFLNIKAKQKMIFFSRLSVKIFDLCRLSVNLS